MLAQACSEASTMFRYTTPLRYISPLPRDLRNTPSSLLGHPITLDGEVAIRYIFGAAALDQKGSPESGITGKG
jgi:hypothetical protein